MREKDPEDDASSEEKTEAPQKAGREPGDGSPEKGMLEDKGLTPFETIRDNRKAVQYETKYQDDQRGDGGSAGPDHGGMR